MVGRKLSAAVVVALLAAPTDAFGVSGILDFSRLPRAGAGMAMYPASARYRTRTLHTSMMDAPTKAVDTKPWMSETGGRMISNAEVMSTVAVTGHLESSEDLEAWLGRRGYKGAVREAMLAKVILARSGGVVFSQAELDLDRAAFMFIQADMYEEEGQKLEAEKTKIVEESWTIGPELLELNEKIVDLKAKGDIPALKEAEERLDVLVEQRKAFDEKIDELDQSAQDKLKNGRWDREDAEILRNNALRSLASTIGEDDELLNEAVALLDRAEEEDKQNGKAAALKLLMEGTSVLEKISLRPDRKASPSSLPARLFRLLVS